LKQLDEIKAVESRSPETKILMKDLDGLTLLLTSKQKIIDTIDSIYSEKTSQINEIHKALSELSLKFEQQIQIKTKKELFSRKESPLTLLGWRQIREEIGLLPKQIRWLTSDNRWSSELNSIWKSGHILFITFFILFGFVLYLFNRIRRYLIGLEKKEIFHQNPYRHLILRLSQNSIILSGITLFLYLYANVRSFYLTIALIQSIIWILLIILFTQWYKDFFKFWLYEKYSIPAQILDLIKLLLHLIRYFAVFYVIIELLIGGNSVLLLLSRMALGASLLIWFIYFLKVWRRTDIDPVQIQTKRSLILRFFSTGLGYAIIGIGPGLELTGYGSFAFYWYSSWGRSAVVLLWGRLTFFVLREWCQQIKKNDGEDLDETTTTALPFRWLFTQLCWLIWIGVFVIAIILAWGGEKSGYPWLFPDTELSSNSG
jgi:hypothetical protein